MCYPSVPCCRPHFLKVSTRQSGQQMCTVQLPNPGQASPLNAPCGPGAAASSFVWGWGLLGGGGKPRGNALVLRRLRGLLGLLGAPAL